jgi:hypothetical protein
MMSHRAASPVDEDAAFDLLGPALRCVLREEPIRATAILRECRANALDPGDAKIDAMLAQCLRERIKAIGGGD